MSKLQRKVIQSAIKKAGKKSDSPLFGHIIKLIARHLLINCVDIYHSNKDYSAYKTYDQLVSLLFGQLNKCLSLREITMGLGLTPDYYRLGLAQSLAKSTMSDGNTKRDNRVFEMLYKELIKYYRTVYAKIPEYKVIDEIKGKNIKIIDSATMGVSLNLFNWAKFRTVKEKSKHMLV